MGALRRAIFDKAVRSVGISGIARFLGEAPSCAGDGDGSAGWGGCSRDVSTIGLLRGRAEVAAGVSALFCGLFPSNRFCLGRI